MEKVLNWLFKADVKFWHFWHPASGVVGGAIMGFLLSALLGVAWLLIDALIA